MNKQILSVLLLLFFASTGSSQRREFVYDPDTGFLDLVNPVNPYSKIELRSASGLFIGERSDFPHLDGLFDEYGANKVFKLDPAGFGDVPGFARLPPGLCETDIVLDGSGVGEGPIGNIPFVGFDCLGVVESYHFLSGNNAGNVDLFSRGNGNVRIEDGRIFLTENNVAGSAGYLRFPRIEDADNANGWSARLTITLELAEQIGRPPDRLSLSWSRGVSGDPGRLGWNDFNQLSFEIRTWEAPQPNSGFKIALNGRDRAFEPRSMDDAIVQSGQGPITFDMHVGWTPDGGAYLFTTGLGSGDVFIDNVPIPEFAGGDYNFGIDARTNSLTTIVDEIEIVSDQTFFKIPEPNSRLLLFMGLIGSAYWRREAR